MLQGWVVVAVALGYIGLLFVIASYGDRRPAARPQRPSAAADLSALARDLLHVLDVLRLGRSRLAHRLRFSHHLYRTDADDRPRLAADHPRSCGSPRPRTSRRSPTSSPRATARARAVAATVALIAIVGTIPYIALQLKAVSSSLEHHPRPHHAETGFEQPMLGDIALFVALSMAAFAVLFGTRHIDATEHQDGLMLAIATESIVKLVAFLAVGVFVTFWLFDGPSALFSQAMQRDRHRRDSHARARSSARLRQ